MEIDALYAAGVKLSFHNQNPSWQSWILRALFSTRRMMRNFTSHTNDETYIANKRRTGAAQYFKPLAPMRCEPVMANGIPAEWITSAKLDDNEAAQRTILYLHGGSFTGGSIDTHRSLCGSIAHVAQARILLIEYRLAPEHPFPAALNDALSAYNWLLENGLESNRIVLVGDSAGGGLALSSLVALRDKGAPMPAAAVGISAITDLACNNETWYTNARYEVVTTAAAARRSIRMYLNGTDPKAPLASPYYANLADLPPILLLIGSKEILLYDATRFAHKAHKAGVDITLEIWKDMIHSWQFAAQFLPEARTAIESISRFIGSHVADGTH